MADFTIEGGLVINSSAAIQSVASIGRKIDEMFVKLNKPIDFDTKPAEEDLKRLAKEADAIEIDAKVGKVEMPDVPKGGLFDGIGGSLASLVSPAGLATAGIAALGAGLAATFEIGKEFETGLQAVSAVTGVTGSALEDIGDRAQNLAAQFGGSAKEQLEVFQTTLSKIGPQLAQDSGALTTFAENVNVLSKTDSALGAAGAVDALTGAMLQFGVNVNDSNEVARESGRFINVLAASAAVGSASVSDVAGAIAVVGATAKNANVSFEETNAALQVLASKSLTGSQAGTALTAVVNKLQSASGPAAAQLKKMGTSSEELGKILTTQGIGPAMEKLKTGMNTLGSTSEKNAFLVSLFGETGVNAAAALLSGGEQLKEFTKGVTGTTAATDQAAINMATLSERISRGTAALQNIAIDTYRVLAPILSSVIGVVSDAFGKVQAAIAPIFTKLTKTFGEVFTRIRPVFAAIAGFLAGAWLIQITTVFSAIGTAVNVVLTVFNKLFDGIVSAVQPVVDALKKAFGFTDDATKSIDVLKIFGDILSGITDAISFWGDVLVEVGGFLVEFLITPLKIGFTILSTIIEPVVSFGKSLFNVGETTQSVGGFFSSFIDVVKQAPTFIKAVTDGFRAFVGSITDLITNFSFDKLTKVLKGETFSDAFTGSLDKTKLEEASKRTLANFDATFKELQVKRGLYENAKTEAEKKGWNDILVAEKARIEGSIDAKKKAGEIDQKQAETLNQKLLDILKEHEKQKQDLVKPPPGGAGGDGGKQDSLKEEIAKAAEENRKLRGESDAAQIKDELERAIKANEEKFLATQRAVQKEIEEVKKKKDVSDKERQALLELLYEKENLVLENGLNQRDEIIRKHDQKISEDALKESDERGKAEYEIIKKRVEQSLKEQRSEIEQRIAAEEKYAETHKSIFQQLADNTIDIFKGISDGFTQAFTTDDSAAKEASATARKEAEKQLDELKKSLKDRTLAFSDYQDKVADINRQIEESGQEAGKSFGDKFVDGLNKSLSVVGKVFDDMGKGILKQYDADNKELADINKELNKEIALQDKFRTTDTVEQADERKKKILKLSKQQTEGQISTGEQLDVAMKSIALSVSGAMVSAAAAGENLWQAFVLSTLDAMNALIPLFTALIMGKQLSELGLPGLLVAGGLIAAMTALVAVARSAVSENGFFKGGDTRDTPVGKVAGVVHGNEVIVNHEEVHGEFDVFEKVRGTLKGGVHMSEIYNAWENSKRPALSDVFVGMNGIIPNYQLTPQPIQIPVVSDYGTVSEIRAQTAVLSNKLDAVLEATEAMPTAFRGNIKMDANIKLDKGAMLKEVTYNNRRKALQ